jgi:tRNA pseudouridine55 synthase
LLLFNNSPIIFSYLSGSKCYIASVELGFETTTLDMEGNVTKTAPCNHVTWQMVKDVLPQFQGSISQIPPIFSAIRKNGKKLYKAARQGVSADDLDIEPRTVDIYRIELIKPNDTVINDNHNDTDDAVLDPPRFDIEVECGGGTYIRSLVRDIGYALDTVATTTRLKRTKQGTFLRSDCLSQEDWRADNIFAAIDRMNERLAEEEEA